MMLAHIAHSGDVVEGVEVGDHGLRGAHNDTRMDVRCHVGLGLTSSTLCTQAFSATLAPLSGNPPLDFDAAAETVCCGLARLGSVG